MRNAPSYRDGSPSLFCWRGDTRFGYGRRWALAIAAVSTDGRSKSHIMRTRAAAVVNIIIDFEVAFNVCMCVCQMLMGRGLDGIGGLPRIYFAHDFYCPYYNHMFLASSFCQDQATEHTANSSATNRSLLQLYLPTESLYAPRYY